MKSILLHRLIKSNLLAVLVIITFTQAIPQVSSQSLATEYLRLIIDNTNQKKHQEAVKVCDKLINLQPDNANAYYLRGYNKYLGGDYEGAIRDFDKTLALNPENLDAYVKRGNAKNQLNDYWGAMRDYRKAQKMNTYETILYFTRDAMKSLFTSKH